MFPDMVASVYSEVLEDLRQESWLERTPSLRERPFVYVSASKATDIVEKVTRKETPFPSFTFDQARENDADYKVYIDFSFEGGSPTSLKSVFGRGALFLSTFGVISMCPPTELILTAKVIDKTNNERVSYRLSDKLRTDWVTGECTPHSENTRPQVVADLTSALYKKIRREGILQEARRPWCRSAESTGRCGPLPGDARHATRSAPSRAAEFGINYVDTAPLCGNRE
jgi:hypothetical protein